MPLSPQSLEKRHRLRGFAETLEPSLTRSPDTEQALRGIADLLAGTNAKDLSAAWKANPAQVCRILATVCGGAPFLISHLLHHPEWLARLAAEDLGNERSSEAYRARLAQLTDGVDKRADITRILREFKYYELTRITVRDLSSDLVPLDSSGEVLAELSHLADALLARAYEYSQARFDADDDGSHFAVIGMGKLGSEELNYSSDVDLVYVCGDESNDDPGATPNLQKVARSLGEIVRRKTENGFLYRIDLDLRPEGASGPLVVSASALADYYERWAETWEKAALMKARPVAGDLAFGWRVIRSMDPIIYRSSMDLEGVEAIRAMKDKIERAKGREGKTFNVKIGRGGIRDIEFISQALQMMYGGKQPQVRQRSTQAALQALVETGALDQDAGDELLEAYRFLRRIENRIQMENERQLYHLPTSTAGRQRLARAMASFEDGNPDKFDEDLTAHRDRVRRIFSRLFDKDEGERILDLFQDSAPSLLANPATRKLAEDLAKQMAHQIEASSSPDRAMNNLDEFIRGVGQRKFFYELLLDRPELVPRLVRLFAASEYLSSYVATHPRLIEPLFDDPDVLLHSRAELEASYVEIRQTLAEEQSSSDPELSLDAVRLFHNRELVNVGLLDLDERIDRRSAEQSLTEIAEVCLDQGVAIAELEVVRRTKKKPTWLKKGEFLVVAMGKMASHELTYGSDLDVIFLYDVPAADEDMELAAQSGFAGLAQKVIWALQTRTHEGTCYEIDARLRPSGNQGLLVSHIATFKKYHAGKSELWERQALLRSRPVAGAKRLAEAFQEIRAEILSRPISTDAQTEVHRIRMRMEAELAYESGGHRDFKTGRGGLLDIETIVQCQQLANGHQHPYLFEVHPIADHIQYLLQHQLISESDSETLLGGWEFLQRLSSRLRIIENRSISDLDAERGDLDEVARRLGYRSTGRASGARRGLLDEYHQRTGDIRAVYEGYLGRTEPVVHEVSAGKAEIPKRQRTVRGAARRRLAKR